MATHDALAALQNRRSTSVRDMAAPAPDDAQLATILRIATRVPDHGKLCPWRIVVLRAAGQQKLGALAAEIFARANPEAEEKHVQAERQRFARAPLCLAVISTPVADTKPVWEQQLSAGAVCLNILHAAHALGFGAKWLTEWVAYDDMILSALLTAAPAVKIADTNNGDATNAVVPSPLGGGLGWGRVGRSGTNNASLPSSPLMGEEQAAARIAGFIYLGTKTTETPERERPRLEDVVAELS